MVKPGLVYSPTSDAVARALVTAQCYNIHPSPSPDDLYTWKSGIRAPAFCNCRNLGRHPGESSLIARALSELVKVEYPRAEAVAGVADAGIRWSAIVGHLLAVPDFFIRKAAKKHGNQPGMLVECSPPEGSAVVIIDDLVASGRSVLNAIDVLEEERGLEVLGVCSIVNWDFTSMHDAFRDRRVRVNTLASYPDLIDAAFNEGLIAQKAIQELRNFYRNPFDHVWDFSRLRHSAVGDNASRGVA